MQHKEHIHFMGVGGIGVSALAEMALGAGHRVSGCDREASGLTRKLEGEGLHFMAGHAASHVDGADLLVYTSAIPPDHPERVAAGERQMSRGMFLARMMAGAESWGVSGTHGKTTTTWLAAHLAIAGGLDPSVFVGGVVPALADGNYRAGSGPFIAELDESDASFLHPRLDVAVITNIESEHLSHYGDDEALFAAFREFAAGVSDSGLLIAGIDNSVAAGVFAAHGGEKLSFGVSPGADVRAEEIRFEHGGTYFNARYGDVRLGEFSLPLPGGHNVLNALAALAAALKKGIPVETLRKALASVVGVERRMERIGEMRGIALYSDYAHHPTEVAATLEALRQRHAGRLLVVFQPHLYSRTRDYHAAFADALAKADSVLVLDIYPAREDPIPGVTSGLVADGIRRNGGNATGPVPLESLDCETLKQLDGCEAVVFMGAGSIDSAARAFAGR